MRYKMLSITSNPNNILELESYLKGLDEQLNFDQEKYADILISLTEAVTNAIRHGNNNDESKKVHIKVRREEKGVLFQVSDEGTGFDPKGIPDPTCAEKIACPGGRGVFIMKALADEIKFLDKGSSVEMFFALK